MATQKLFYTAPNSAVDLPTYKSWTTVWGTALAQLGWVRATYGVTYTLSAAANAVGSTTVYTGTFADGGSNALAGVFFTTAGFSTGANNGYFLCTASTTTTITLRNSAGVSETHAATAVPESGSVIWANAVLPPAIQASTIQNWRGLWAQATAYAVGDIVTDGTQTWQCQLVESASYAATGVTQSGSTSTLTGTFTSASSAWVGFSIVIAGFVATPANNGTFTILTANATTITYTNGSGATESHAATLVIASGPTTDNGATAGFHWIVFQYEIWKTNGSNSTTCPIYLFLYYGMDASSRALMKYYIGTTHQINQGCVLVGNTFPTVTTMGALNVVQTAASSFLNCYFCGDADNVSVAFWTGSGGAGTNSGSIFLVIDRAKDQFGTALDTYFTCVNWNNSTGLISTLYKNGAGTWAPPSTGPSPSSTLFCVNAGTSATSKAYNGMSPAFPVFPIVGYIGNPLLGMCATYLGDSNDGQLYNVTMYGRTVTFLAWKLPSPAGLNGATGFMFGIRWEVA